MGWLQKTLDALEKPSAPTTPTRALNAAFQPSLTGYTLCLYTLEMVQTTGQDGSVELRSDAANPPTTVRASARINNANAATHTSRQQLVYICPPAHFVKLVSAGTGTPSIAHQTEDVMHTP